MLLFGYPGGSYLRLSQMQTVCEVLDNLRVLLGTLVLIQLLLQVIAIPLRLIDRNLLSAGGVLGDDRDMSVIVQSHETTVAGDNLTVTVRGDDLG